MNKSDEIIDLLNRISEVNKEEFHSFLVNSFEVPPDLQESDDVIVNWSGNLTVLSLINSILTKLNHEKVVAVYNEEDQLVYFK